MPGGPTALLRLGAKQLIVDGNWITIDPVHLFDVERYTYTAGNVISVDRYVTGAHIGPDQGWAILPGDKYSNMSCLLHPRQLPLNMKQVWGFPNMIMESQWVAPNKYQAEGPFLTAAYGSLTGVGPLLWYSTGAPAWQQPFGSESWHPPMAIWQISTPEQLGQFPAAALMYRRHYIKRGKPAVVERESLSSLWNERTPIIAENPGYDPNRENTGFAPRSNIRHGVNPLAFLVGPVEAKYNADSARSYVAPLKQFIPSGHHQIISDTRQIQLNYRKGICTLNAPKAQGVCGFLRGAGKHGVFHLGAVTIRSRNKYAAVLVVAMDNRPLTQSHEVLVQVGTTMRPSGWQSKPATFTVGKKTVRGHSVVSTGSNPWRIRDTHVTITLRDKNVAHAEMLNVNGYFHRALRAKWKAGKVTLRLPRNAMYVVLKK